MKPVGAARGVDGGEDARLAALRGTCDGGGCEDEKEEKCCKSSKNMVLLRHAEEFYSGFGRSLCPFWGVRLPGRPGAGTRGGDAERSRGPRVHWGGSGT